MKELRGLTLSETEDIVRAEGEPRFRGKQLFQWISRSVTDFGEMRNLPKTLRQNLAEKYRVDSLRVIRDQQSRSDGTRKFLFALEDGNAVESVFMKYSYGNTVCVSSQAGCRMGCAFCASGIGGLRRNLTAGEMISQILDIERMTGEKVSRTVVMGTGEPFDNYDGLTKFIRVMNDVNGRNMGLRNFTVSTCGLVPEMLRFAGDFPQVNLAVSLHAPTDEQRSRIMPVNRRYPLRELMEAAKEFETITSRRVTFEYALIRGVNDRDRDVEQLIRLLSGTLCHVNLIPLNEVSETGFVTAGRERAKAIQKTLEQKGIPATVRRQLGADIDGACGQLRLENSQKYIE